MLVLRAGYVFGKIEDQTIINLEEVIYEDEDDDSRAYQNHFCHQDIIDPLNIQICYLREGLTSGRNLVKITWRQAWVLFMNLVPILILPGMN